MRLYNDSIARLIDPTAQNLRSILERQAGDYIDCYDIDEGARLYAQKLDDELSEIGLSVTADERVYIDGGSTPDGEKVIRIAKNVNSDRILDRVDSRIENSNGYFYLTREWPAIVGLMENDIREELNAERDTYNTPQKFFTEYAKRHEKEFGEQWELDKADPIW